MDHTNIDVQRLIDLQARIDASQKAIQEHLENTVAEQGLAADLVTHLRTMRLYFRVPYMMCLWTPEEVRSEVELAIGEHLLAMKLFDDVVDDDSGLSPLDLAAAFFIFEHRAIRDLCELAGDPRGVVRHLDTALGGVARGQVRAKRETATTVETWIGHASTYGGDFLGMYGELASLAGRCPEAAEPATRFGRAFGMLITMSDDWRDYERHRERQGNLRHIVDTPGAKAQALDKAHELATEAVRAAARGNPHDDLYPLIQFHLADLVSNIEGHGSMPMPS